MVMAVDACEERTPAKGDDSFKEFRKGGSKFRGDKPSKPSPLPEKPTSKPLPLPDKPVKKVKRYNPGFNPEKASETTGP